MSRLRPSAFAAVLALAVTCVTPALAGDGLEATVDIRGTVSALTDAAITVRNDERELRCARSDHSPALEQVRVGDRVAMVCRNLEGTLLLVAWKRIGESVEARMLEIRGVVAEVTDTSITVKHRERSHRLTCHVGERQAGLVEEIRTGDRVKMLCARRGSARPVLVKLKRLDVERDEYVDIAGSVTRNQDGSLTIAQPDAGRSLTCRVPASGELAELAASIRVGARAAMLCRDGVLVKVKLLDVPVSSELKEFLFVGEISMIGDDRITVDTEAGPRSCLIPEELRAAVGERTLGQRVKLLCKGKDEAHATLAGIRLVT